MEHQYDLQEERLNFLEIDERTTEILQHFYNETSEEFPRILDAFYDHLTSIPSLKALVGDKVDRLKKAQQSHWQRLFEGKFDTAYFDGVTRIGLAHERIGLQPRWYIGGYNFVLKRLHRLAAERYAGDNAFPAPEVIAAISSAVLLDMDVSISVYQEAYIRERQAREIEKGAIAEFDSTIEIALDAVTQSGQQMEETARTLKSNSDHMKQQAALVAAASEQTSGNVNSVAAASEELSASIGEISRRIAQSSDLSQKAKDTTESGQARIQNLSEAAEQIGEVVGLINKIAAQTKLLSLNATIEAARAGEAGKGFGVVATEVKNLANQTEQATRVIERQIGDIQSATNGAVSSIRDVADSINQLHEVAAGISAAIEQQNATTQEIASSIQHVASAASEVTDKIGEVNRAAEETDTVADSVLTASEELKQNSVSMRGNVDRFLDQVRLG